MAGPLKKTVIFLRPPFETNMNIFIKYAMHIRQDILDIQHELIQEEEILLYFFLNFPRYPIWSLTQANNCIFGYRVYMVYIMVIQVHGLTADEFCAFKKIIH